MYCKISFKNFTKIEEITEEAKAKEAQKGSKKKEVIPEPIKYDTFQEKYLYRIYHHIALLLIIHY